MAAQMNYNQDTEIYVQPRGQKQKTFASHPTND